MINDVTGLNGDPNMAHILSDWDCPIVIMHNSNGYDYKEIKSEVRNALENSVQRALSAGVQPENIIIDPGIGFRTKLSSLYIKHSSPLQSTSKPYPS